MNLLTDETLNLTDNEIMDNALRTDSEGELTNSDDELFILFSDWDIDQNNENFGNISSSDESDDDIVLPVFNSDSDDEKNLELIRQCINK
jgi:hypothetical protein